MPELQNLVIAWNWCHGYDNCGSEVKCVQYESAEAFLVHLDDATKKYASDKEAYYVAFDKWQNQYRETWKQLSHVKDNLQHKERNGTDTDALRKKADRLENEFQQILKARPDTPSPKITIGGLELDLDDFYTKDYDTKKASIDLPDVYNLQEWFDEKLKEN